MRRQWSRISGAWAYFSVGTYDVSSKKGRYTYDSTSHWAPGYRFQYHVPPKSPPFSMIRMSSMPA
jgi:hypothetical protein